MYPEKEEINPYTQRIHQVLGELRVSLPTAKQTAFLNRGYNSLLEEHGCLETITDDEIIGVWERIVYHTSPIALEVY
jgi:hypothetical protein